MTITDSRGVRHTVDVVAESLFETAVLGVQVLRRDGWIDGMVGGATRIAVEVREPVRPLTGCRSAGSEPQLGWSGAMNGCK